MVKKKEDSEKVKISALVLKNWWKVVFILLVAGLVFSGFKIKCGDNSFVKQPLKMKQKAK